jgi:peptidoglycan/LPS O-acetylase OafA/YrhL
LPEVLVVLDLAWKYWETLQRGRQVSRRWAGDFHGVRRWERSLTRSASAYRPDIDGLRAISILLVVLYHAQPWLAPGGYIGVDVFFVISGFLITRLILSEIEAGGFSALTFYARRVRRIFPALIVVLAAAWLIGWFVLLPNAFALLGKNIAAGVGFVSNLFQLTQSGYFAPDIADNPLVHLWSLGIEEQFYIFWPPALLLIAGSKRRHVYIFGLAAASFGVSLLVYAGYKDWSFYSPLPRAWELLAGSLIAERQLARKEPDAWMARHQNLLAMIGIALTLAGAFLLDKASLFPGFGALFPVLGAMLLIVSADSWVNRALLASRPMVLVGLVSYPLYLWHWPLLSYLSIIRNGVPNFLEIWLAVALSVGLAFATYYLVELPVRRRKGWVPRLAFGLVAIGGVGLATVAGSGFDIRFPPGIRDIAAIQPEDNSGLRSACFQETATTYSDDCIEKGDKPLLFLWGDSTAASLSPGMQVEAGRSGFRLAHFAAAGCAPILAAGKNTRCDAANENVFVHLKSAHPDIVLLHSQWEAIDPALLRKTIEQLAALKIPRIVILGPAPIWKRTLPHSLVNYYRFHHVIPDRLASGVSGPADDLRMGAISKEAGVDYISAWHLLCNAEGCLTCVGPTAGDVVATDIVHLSEAGSGFLAAAVMRRLIKQAAD